jgi:hypothetical protein
MVRLLNRSFRSSWFITSGVGTGVDLEIDAVGSRVCCTVAFPAKNNVRMTEEKSAGKCSTRIPCL